MCSECDTCYPVRNYSIPARASVTITCQTAGRSLCKAVIGCIGLERSHCRGELMCAAHELFSVCQALQSQTDCMQCKGRACSCYAIRRCSPGHSADACADGRGASNSGRARLDLSCYRPQPASLQWVWGGWTAMVPSAAACGAINASSLASCGVTDCSTLEQNMPEIQMQLLLGSQ